MRFQDASMQVLPQPSWQIVQARRDWIERAFFKDKADLQVLREKWSAEWCFAAQKKPGPSENDWEGPFQTSSDAGRRSRIYARSLVWSHPGRCVHWRGPNSPHRQLWPGLVQVQDEEVRVHVSPTYAQSRGPGRGLNPGRGFNSNHEARAEASTAVTRPRQRPHEKRGERRRSAWLARALALPKAAAAAAAAATT